MRCDDAVFETQPWMLGPQRFWVGDIERGARNLAAAKRRSIDEEGARFHFRKRDGIEAVTPTGVSGTSAITQSAITAFGRSSSFATRDRTMDPKHRRRRRRDDLSR